MPNIPLLLRSIAALAVPASAMAAPNFNRDVRPILSGQCISCHGPDEHERKGGLRLDTFEGATSGGKSGKAALVPGNRAASELWVRVTTADADDRMPPVETGHSLKPEEIETLGAWIDAGSRYERHWSFIPPVKAEVPAGTSGPAVIDHFISKELATRGLALQKQADPRTLLRRLSLDLTGLPPSLEDAKRFDAAFSADPGAAYARAVDQLLASPHFGERWAKMWLDLARYADSRGYGSDPLRLNIWRYRDWVIDAYNRNLPFDQFTVEQLAGDLLPEAGTEQLLATAFHRNTMTNTLGGTIDEEFRVAAVKDRAETTAQVWMGLTMRCAQCHTHKFDPITNDEYYQFYAIFNQTQDNDLPDEFPTAPTPTREEQAKLDALKTQLDAARAAMDVPSPDFLARQAAWEQSLRAQEAQWKTLAFSTAKARSGAALTVRPDGSLLSAPSAAETDLYTLEAPVSTPGLTGLRIDALPDDSLPGKGPGRANAGNFVLNEVKVFERPNASQPPTGRFVRIELPGAQKFLHLAEVQVFSGAENIAPQGKATQSSIDYDGVPQRAIDGNTNGDYTKNSVTHTHGEDNPWWELDLGSDRRIDQVIVWNRTDGGTEARLEGWAVKVLSGERKEIFATKPTGVPRPSTVVSVDGRREIAVRVASATHEQPQFEAAKAIDGNLAKDSGWAIGGRLGTPQSLVLELAEPLCVNYGCSLTLEMRQTYPQHGLGHFRVSGTTQPAPLRALPEALSPVLAKGADQRSEPELKALRAFYAQLDPARQAKLKEVAELEKQLAAIKPVETPVMRELPTAKRRVTKTMIKGNYLVTDKEVGAGLPAAFHPSAGQVDRLALAKWLVSRENPLTARVQVNRFWSQLFGRGLVMTEEDFGTQGTFPSHPELLDWLAVEFMESRWDVKKLLKLVVSSATYRQSSEVTPASLERDPQNVLLSRGARFRLDAEAVRDQALALSGLLSPKMFGPSVYPPQPDGIWRAAFNGERSYPTSTGEDRYRRGLYVFLRRTAPNPSMATFDAPNRELCTLRRIRTNTPLQAFVTLNDPAYVEMAQALARRLVREAGATAESRLRHGLELALLREPPADKLRTLVSLYEEQLALYRTAPAEAKKLAQDPLNPLPDTTDWAEQAALTVVANVLLNLDAVLVRG